MQPSHARVESTFEEWSDGTVCGGVTIIVEEILDKLREREAYYAVIGGRTRTPIGKTIIGTTT